MTLRSINPTATGIASAACNFHSTCDDNQKTPSLSEDQINFLEKHKSEIEHMYEFKRNRIVGDWKTMGSGISKLVLVHPDLPGMLIKVPRDVSSGQYGKTGEDDLRLHHAALQRIRSLAPSFDRIVLPESHLYPTSKGLIVVEQRFDLDAYRNVANDPDKKEATEQFYEFVDAAHLCDVSLEGDQNAGIISGLFPIKIALFDLDCRKRAAISR